MVICDDSSDAAPATQDHIASLFGRYLRVRTPCGGTQDGWQLHAGVQVDRHGLVDVVKGEQELQVDCLHLLQLNPLPPPNLLEGAGAAVAACTQEHKHAGAAKHFAREVYLARHPHVEGARHAADSDYVESAATDHVVLRGAHVDMGSVKVACASWRGAHVDKTCCAFRLASHFISRFHKVCLDPSVPVASHAFTLWLRANSDALVGSHGVLSSLTEPWATTATHVSPLVTAVACLAQECCRLLKLQPMLVRTRGPTKVYGDIHGQVRNSPSFIT